MTKALLGILIGIVLSVSAAACYVRMGFVDPRADADIGTLERKLAMPALDASVDRRAPDLKNPIPATDENLMAQLGIRFIRGRLSLSRMCRICRRTRITTSRSMGFV